MTARGARLTNLKETACPDLRRAILSAKDDFDMLWVLRWTGRPQHGEPAIYAELMRTNAMQRRFAGRVVRSSRSMTPIRVGEVFVSLERRARSPIAVSCWCYWWSWTASNRRPP